MACDEKLAKRIRAVLSDTPSVSEKRMFGGIAFMLRDHMCVGVVDSTLMARVGPDEYATALSQSHVREMDFTGKPLRGYVYVDPEGIRSAEDLRAWIARCVAFVTTLPPKAEKRKAKK